MAFSFVYVSLIFLIFFILNSYFISKIWTTKYTNFNFFESFNISLLILFFLLFSIFSPIFIIFKNVNINSENAMIASKWILLIIQVTLVLIYIIGYKKIIINFAVDLKKIGIFLFFAFLFFLTWFLLVKYKDITLDRNHIFLTNGESIFNIFNSIFINIFCGNNSSNFDIVKFYEIILIPFNLLLIIFSLLSLVDFIEVFTLRNFKVLLISIFILLFFCSSCFVKVENTEFFISKNIMWSIFPLISVYSIAFKTNNEITTNSDLSLTLNITILTLPFFFNDLYTISIFLSAIFFFYIYSMKFEGCSFETLKLFSYTILSYSMSKLVTTTTTSETLPWILLIVSLILISLTYAINRNHNFYLKIRTIDNFISKNILMIFSIVLVVVISVFFAISIGTDRMNQLWLFFFKDGNINLSFVIVMSIIWMFSLIFFANAFINRKTKLFNTPILLLVFASLLVLNPFFKTDLIFVTSVDSGVEILYNNTIILSLIPILISYVGMSWKKINTSKDKKIYKILYITFESLLTSIIIINCCFYITYILGVTKWIIF